jgi:hypothetical protein
MKIPGATAAIVVLWRAADGFCRAGPALVEQPGLPHRRRARHRRRHGRGSAGSSRCADCVRRLHRHRRRTAATRRLRGVHRPATTLQAAIDPDALNVSSERRLARRPRLRASSSTRTRSSSGGGRRVAMAASHLLARLTPADRSGLMVMPLGPTVELTWAHHRVREALERITGSATPDVGWEFGTSARRETSRPQPVGAAHGHRPRCGSAPTSSRAGGGGAGGPRRVSGGRSSRRGGGGGGGGGGERRAGRPVAPQRRRQARGGVGSFGFGDSADARTSSACATCRRRLRWRGARPKRLRSRA